MKISIVGPGSGWEVWGAHAHQPRGRAGARPRHERVARPLAAHLQRRGRRRARASPRRAAPGARRAARRRPARRAPSSGRSPVRRRRARAPSSGAWRSTRGVKRYSLRGPQPAGGHAAPHPQVRERAGVGAQLTRPRRHPDAAGPRTSVSGVTPGRGRAPYCVRSTVRPPRTTVNPKASPGAADVRRDLLAASNSAPGRAAVGIEAWLMGTIACCRRASSPPAARLGSNAYSAAARCRSAPSPACSARMAFARSARPPGSPYAVPCGITFTP